MLFHCNLPKFLTESFTIDIRAQIQNLSTNVQTWMFVHFDYKLCSPLNRKNVIKCMKDQCDVYVKAPYD